MADYDVVALREVENQSERFGFDPRDLQFRVARDALGCENIGVSYLYLGPGFRIPFGHRHERQEEVYVLLSGSVRMKIGDDLVELQPLTAVRVGPETMRAYEGGPEGGEIVVIGVPKTTPNDAETHNGWWSD